MKQEIDQVNFLLNEDYNVFFCHQEGTSPTIQCVLRKNDSIVYIFDKTDNPPAYIGKAAMLLNTKQSDKYLKKLMRKNSINSILVDHNRKLDDEILAEIPKLQPAATANITIRKPVFIFE